MNEKLDQHITLYGSGKDIEEAKKHLQFIEGLESLPEPKARLEIQGLIDARSLKASILFDGNTVWSKKRIIRNLRQIVREGKLYRRVLPRYVSIGSMLRVPTRGEPLLTDYFYKFLHLNCGSIAHYDIHGWIAEYPMAEDLRKFFIKNEYGKRVLDDLPRWYTDAIEVVKEIERVLKVQTKVGREIALRVEA